MVNAIRYVLRSTCPLAVAAEGLSAAFDGAALFRGVAGYGHGSITVS